MKVLIFTEGGIEFGLGHVIRCLSLYEEIEKRNIDVEIMIFGDIKDTNILNNKNHKFVDWMSKEFLTDILNNETFSIIDSYIADIDIYNFISSNSIGCTFLDDTNRLEYPKGTVVHPSLDNIESTEDVYKTANQLTGLNYVMLRKEFSSVKREMVREYIEEMLITLGGSDKRRLLKDIYSSIRKSQPDVKINIVLGNAIDDNSDLYKNDNTVVYSTVNSSEMKNLMLNSDLAITAAGQTIYELISTQTPFIPISVIQNQTENLIKLNNLGLTKLKLSHSSSDLTNVLLNQIILYDDFDFRKTLVDTYSNLIDGEGPKRIIDNLLNQNNKYYLRHVTDRDINDIFYLSNQEYVRRHSINKEKIKYENHVKWFENVLKSENDCFYVIVKNDGEFGGQIRYKILNDEAVISISLDKSLHGKGLSKKFLQESIQLFEKERNDVKKVIAFISEDNIASRKLFSNFGFLFVEKDDEILKYVYTLN